MITTEDTALVIIDVQEKLVPAMHNKEALLDNLKKMVKGARILGLPILLTEQKSRRSGADRTGNRRTLAGRETGE